MTRTSIDLNDNLYRYLLDVSLREPELFRRLRDAMATHPRASMQIAPEQGQFMALLVRLLGVRRIIEIGVFTGYSSLWMARALPADGELIACDVSEEWTAIAREYWQEAGVENRIRLRLAPAVDTLTELLADGQAGTFDLVFIDADKENVDRYYELSLQLLRPGGLILVDNVLWSGRVIDPAVTDPGTEALRVFNRKLHTDERIELSMLPVGDGLTLAMKR